MKWYIKALRHYADFSGRARRKEFWLFMLVWLVLFYFGFMFMTLLSILLENDVYPLMLSYWAATILPAMAVGVRRLHDIGKSGWLILLPVAVVLCFFSINILYIYNLNGLFLAFFYFIKCIGIPVFMILMCIPGQCGENKYGPDPKTSPEIFSEPARMKSAGLTFLIGSIAALPASIFGFQMEVHDIIYLDYIVYFLFIAIHSILLVMGILMMTGKLLCGAIGKDWLTMIFLFGIFFVLFIFNSDSFRGLIQFYISKLGIYFSIALAAGFVFLLYKIDFLLKLISFFTIYFFSVILLYNMNSFSDSSFATAIIRYINRSDYLEFVWYFKGTWNSASKILITIAYIILTATFLSRIFRANNSNDR